MPRPRITQNDTALGVLSTLLAVALPAVDAVPLPGASVVLGSLLEVIHGIDKTKQNEENLSQLQDAVVRLSSSVIEPLSKRSASQITPELRYAVDQLTSKLMKCSNQWRSRPKRGWVTQFVQRDQEAHEIERFSLEIQNAIEVFKLSAAVRQELIGHEINENVQALIEDNAQNNDLRAIEDLNPAKQAGFMSGRSDAPGTCFEGTRVSVLADLKTWIAETDPAVSPPLFWLSGIAGVGKSTIAQTIASQSSGCWVASFFCSRQEADLRDPARILPTLAYQLAHLDPQLRRFIVDALRNHPSIAAESLQRQFDKLLLEPLQRLRPSRLPVLLVLDAFDECESRGCSKLLQIFATAAARPDFPAALKALITSRPERHIQLVLNKHGPFRVMHLHSTDMRAVQDDITTFLRASLETLPSSLGLNLSPSWVTENQLQALVIRSNGLFVAATTMLHFIGDEKVNDPRNQLRILLGLRRAPSGANLYLRLDEIYLQVLASSVASTTNKQDIIDRFQQIVGTILIARNPLPARAMESLLDVEEGTVDAALLLLRSVIIPPSSLDDPPRICHPSFREFLTTRSRCTDDDFFVDEPTHEARMASHCLRLMNAKLARDMTCIEQYGASATLPRDMGSRVIQAISPELDYACRYWSNHLAKAQTPSPTLALEVSQFARRTLLYYLEAASLLGGMNIAWGPLRGAQQSATSLMCDDDVVALLGDAYRLIHVYYDAFNAMPYAVYSAVPLMQRETALYKVYGSVRPSPASPLSFRPHHHGVWSVALSTDGTRLVSGSVDRAVRVHDVTSGQQLSLIRGHSDWVMSVAISPDGSRVASASHDRTVRVWDALTGQQLRLLEHTGWANAVAFSIDGRRLATGTEDAVTSLWDITSGALLIAANAGFGPVTSCAFSPHGSYFAASFFDGTVQVWTADLDTIVSTLVGHTNCASDLSFGPDDRRIASASWDMTGRIWDIRSGEVLFTLSGHTDGLNAISWGRGCESIASVADDTTVRLWDACTGREVAVAEHAALGITVSPGPKRVVSSGWSGIIVVWDAESLNKMLEINVADSESKNTARTICP